MLLFVHLCFNLLSIFETLSDIMMLTSKIVFAATNSWHVVFVFQLIWVNTCALSEIPPKKHEVKSL